MPRAPVLKRMKRGSSGDIFLKLLEQIRRHDSRRHDPHVDDRRIPRRDGGRFRRAVPVRRGRAVRPAGRVQLLGRRDQRELSARRQGRCADDLQPQTAADGAAAQDLAAAEPALGGAGDAGADRRSVGGERTGVGGAHGRARRRRSTASATSAIRAVAARAGADAPDAHARKRTTTTWSATWWTMACSRRSRSRISFRFCRAARWCRVMRIRACRIDEPRAKEDVSRRVSTRQAKSLRHGD